MQGGRHFRCILETREGERGEDSKEYERIRQDRRGLERTGKDRKGLERKERKVRIG